MTSQNWPGQKHQKEGMKARNKGESLSLGLLSLDAQSLACHCWNPEMKGPVTSKLNAVDSLLTNSPHQHGLHLACSIQEKQIMSLGISAAS